MYQQLHKHPWQSIPALTVPQPRWGQFAGEPQPPAALPLSPVSVPPLLVPSGHEELKTCINLPNATGYIYILTKT